MIEWTWSPITNWGGAHWSAFFSFCLLVVGIIQSIRAINNQRKWATLQACDRYDTDKVIQDVVLALRAKVDVPTTLEEKQLYACRLLNYFDSIAIGIEQGFYVKEIAKPHIGRIIFARVADLTAKGWTSREEIDKDFPALKRLLATW